MKVLVDATMLDGGPSGAATRLLGLGRAHAARGEVEVVHLVRPGLQPLPGLICEPFEGSTTPASRARSGRRWDAALAASGAVLLAAGALPVPRVAAAPVVLTVHDLRFLDADAGTSRLRRWWGRHRLAPNLERAAHVVAVSASTAAGLRRVAPRVPVTVVPNAGTPDLQPPDTPDAMAAFRRRAGLNQRYVLAIGAPVKHKNLGRLVDALAAARRQDSGRDLGLVVAGRLEPAQAAAVGRRARSAGVEEHVRLVGVLDVATLSAVLAGADVLAVPSITEGFSIPVVDAQRFGVPVVTADTGALPDTVGGGGWLASAQDPAAFGAALMAAVTPGPERDRVVQLGRAAADRWSWELSAETLEGLWRQVADTADPAPDSHTDADPASSGT